jgi:hypothetical protein
LTAIPVTLRAILRRQRARETVRFIASQAVQLEQLLQLGFQLRLQGDARVVFLGVAHELAEVSDLSRNGLARCRDSPRSVRRTFAFLQAGRRPAFELVGEFAYSFEQRDFPAPIASAPASVCRVP